MGGVHNGGTPIYRNPHIPILIQMIQIVNLITAKQANFCIHNHLLILEAGTVVVFYFSMFVKKIGLCFFPTSLCGVLVFRLDPAGATSASASPSAASSSSSTHSLTHSLTQAQYTELPGGAAARWPPLARGCLLPGRRSTQSVRTPASALPFCVAGAVHRAFWRSCGEVAAAGLRLPFAWQTQYTEPPHFPFAW